ncbi:MAG TPA: c-type cytochrome [Nitrospira sp.]|nr:c-type cytochrome [Nitrospira sp.]
MDRQPHGRRLRAGRLLLASFACLLIAQQTIASPPKTKTPASPGKAAAGRDVFNGKAICHYCHGIDGHRDKRPQLAPDTAALIAQLNPQPADLRNPKTLRLKSDQARRKAIREGHSGTAMFPTTTLTNQELVDTLSYLATLRKEGHSGAKASDVSPSIAQDMGGGEETRPLAGDSTRGAELYQASCTVCHGPRAEGGVGPQLAGNTVLGNDQAFWKVVHEGRHVMPPLKDAVSDQQLTDIRAWLRTLP